jgi:glycosyltransferase involved in cell wall biosynthesis
MTLIEAMSLAKPVVATDVGGVSETVKNGETGLLVPAGDSGTFASALVRLASDPSLASGLGRAGRERQRALFSMDRMVAQYRELFGTMLAAQKRQRAARLGGRQGTRMEDVSARVRR